MEEIIFTNALLVTTVRITLGHKPMNQSLIVLTTNAEEMITWINRFHYVENSNDAAEKDRRRSTFECIWY